MNRKGFIINIVAFIVALLLGVLLVIMTDAPFDAMLDAAPGVAPDGGTARMIIFGGGIVVILGGIWFLTRPSNQLGWTR